MTAERDRKPIDRTSVHADGPLAEVMCYAYLLELTDTRARQLWESHRMHLPDDCWVHLQVAMKLQCRDRRSVRRAGSAVSLWEGDLLG